MPTRGEKLSGSLALLHDLQQGGRRVFRSREIPRVHRERLSRNGFLQQVMNGWLISSSPSVSAGDSTLWYASFWQFCERYASARFGDRWHLSPEQSLLLSAESTAVPAQVVVYAPAGTNNALDLPFGTGLYDLKQPRMPPAADLHEIDGLRVYTSAAALLRVPDTFFSRYPVEAQVVLAGIRDASDLLARLLGGGHPVVAGRLAGAFRRTGRIEVADEILQAMRAAEYDVRESDPFEPRRTLARIDTHAAPIASRLKAMWESMRAVVLEVFPRRSGDAIDPAAYLERVDDVYQADAYHSLSIEGYRVTPALVERVRSGGWNPHLHETDRRDRDTLAARGYVMLASGGYPWTIVRVEDRKPYLVALESASVVQDAGPFARFIAERVRRASGEIPSVP